MACTLSIQDYLRFLMIKQRERNETEGKGKTNGIPQGSLLVATVYKYEKVGGESLFYSKRILGSKQSEPISTFVQDMIGKAGRGLFFHSIFRPNVRIWRKTFGRFRFCFWSFSPFF